MPKDSQGGTTSTDLQGEEIQDGQEEKKKRRFSSSVTYEVPSLDQVGGATHGNIGGHTPSSDLGNLRKDGNIL